MIIGNGLVSQCVNGKGEQRKKIIQAGIQGFVICLAKNSFSTKKGAIKAMLNILFSSCIMPHGQKFFTAVFCPFPIWPGFFLDSAIYASLSLKLYEYMHTAWCLLFIETLGKERKSWHTFK